MSIKFDKEILSNDKLTLKINYWGIKDCVADASDLKLSIYAYYNNGKPIFSEQLNLDQIKSLYNHLNQISIIRNSSKIVSGKFIEASGEANNILKTLIDKLKDKDEIKRLWEEEDDSGYNIVEKLSGLQTRELWQTEIKNLKLLLEIEEDKNKNIVEEIKKCSELKMYYAGQPEKIFQKWIEKNIKWIFGIEYIKKHDFEKIGLHSEADLLMEAMDGFIDLIELKRPKFEVFNYDKSHKSYYPSTELSKTIGQCIYYLSELEDIKLKVEKEHKVKIFRPRIKIIAGRTEGFNDNEYKALRMLNSNLNCIEIVTYDYLLNSGEKMINTVT